MEAFTLYLQATGPENDRRNRRVFILNSLWCVLFSVMLYFRYSIVLSVITIVGGLSIMVYALGYKKFVKRQFIRLDEWGIRAHIYKKMITWPHYKKIDTAWNDIESIAIRPLHILITSKDGTEQTIELGDLLYKQHQIFKSKLEECIKTRNLKVATAPTA